MDREALKRIQDFVKRQNRQKKDELPSKTIDEMIEDAKKLDEKRARARKTKTKQEIASEELEYMQREFDNAPVEVTEEENKIVDLRFRGSTNQRKIDVQASLKKNEIVQLKFGDEERYAKV